MSPSLPPVLGPYSYSVLEERIADYEASVKSFSQSQPGEGYSLWKGNKDRQWCDLGDEKRFRSHMSQGPATPGSIPSSTQDGGRELFSRSAQTLPPIFDPSRVGRRNPIEHSSTQVRGVPTSESTISPRTQTSEPYSSNAEQKASHPNGMQTILNPPGAKDVQNKQPPFHVESPPIPVARPPAFPNSATYSPNERYMPNSTPSSLTSHASTNSQDFRRIMTPVSPSNRPASLANINLPKATIDAKRSPFIPSRSTAYTADGSELPFPGRLINNTPPTSLRTPNGMPISTDPAPPERRFCGQLPQGPRSRSNSPSTYSSFSQRSHTSPASQYDQQAPQPPSTRYYTPSVTTEGSSRQAQLTLESEPSQGPVTNAVGQSTYQLMTIDTDQGPIQVPVDVQAASKMADEKRKRNAGASARFRQRRKEKEREASQTIAKLEHQMMEIREEREHYRQERDYFRDMVYSSPSKSQVTPRPPSPRQRNMAPIGGNLAASTPQWQGPEERGGQLGRNTRRRTSAYTPTYDLPPPVHVRPNQTPVYTPSPSFPFPAAEMRASGAGLGSRPTMPLPPRSGPYDPSVQSSYNRSWNAAQ